MASGLPQTMLAAVLDGTGPPDAFEIRSVPVPALKRDHVIIALDYASAGSWDAKARSGAWGDIPKGTILGADGSGTVAAVGEGVTRLRARDRVYSYSYDNPDGGFYAQYVSVPADRVERVPAQLDQRVAGAMPCVALTAHTGLRVLKVERDDALLVFGASGGVGSMAVWLAAHAIGASVIGTARHDAFAYVKHLGATRAVAPNDARFEGRFDAALLTANAEPVRAWLTHLKDDALVAYPNGVEPEPQFDDRKTIAYDGEMSRSAFEALNAAIGKREIPLAVREHPLAEVAQAHRKLDHGHVIGKIVLQIS